MNRSTFFSLNPEMREPWEAAQAQRRFDATSRKRLRKVMAALVFKQPTQVPRYKAQPDDGRKRQKLVAARRGYAQHNALHLAEVP